MSVIIRLQGLPPSAGGTDIRNFFKGISLPPGRVHIIGGDKGDALIAFSSYEDARQAMMLNMGYIGDSQIFLFLSGTAEMRRRIREINIHSSASGRSFAEPAPAQQAVSASQPQQLPLQQDSFWGTQFTHTIDHKGQGYIGRGPSEARGTKRPHQDESGQSPPLTGTAKRMKTTIRCREIITKL